MSYPAALNQAYYNDSDSSDDGAGDDDADIRDIIGAVDIRALRQQLLSEVENPDPMKYFIKDQQQQFNKYIPSWMDPNFRSWPLRHPALRPDDTWMIRDEWIFPSDYAKRWGVDKRAPLDNPGRSMLSPNNQHPDLDWTEDFQAVVFHGYTADELKEQGAFDPDMQIDGSLQGLDPVLHPLVRRANWTQSRMEGNTVENAKLWYNYTGQDRRWDAATNDEVWDALQPVLQLVSKVLYSNHPFWTSIMDLCKIRPMDISRVPVPPPGADTLHYELEDRDMYPEAKALRDSGFDSKQVVANMLRAYVRFRFNDTIRLGAYAYTALLVEPDPAGRVELIINISPDSVWPLIIPTYSKSEKFVLSTALAAIILHELAHCARDAIAVLTEVRGWHSNLALRRPRPDDDFPIAPELSQPTDEQENWLFQLGMKMGSLNRRGYKVAFPQFLSDGIDRALILSSFENEFRAEEGWAFENQLWGGVMNTLSGIAVRDGFPQVTGWLQQWPFAMRAPRPWFRAGYSSCGEFDDNGYPGWLLDPPPSLITRNTAVPVTMMSRLYDEDFWSADFARFSHAALRFPVHEWQGRPLKSSFFFDLIPIETLRRALVNRQAWPWLSSACDLLFTAGEVTLADWVQIRANDAAGPAVARRRFRYESRRWRSSDAAIYAAADRLNWIVIAARARLAEHRAGADADAEVDKAARRDAYLEQAALFADAGLDLARLAGWEVSALQFSVSECARLRPDGRASVRRYLVRAGLRIENWFRQLFDLVIPAAAEVLQVVDVPLGPPSSSGGSGPLQQRQQGIRDRVAATHEVLNSTKLLFAELGKSVDVLRGVDPAGQGDAAAAQYTFSLLAERSSNRLQRTRVEKLALQRLCELSVDSPLITILTACAKILARS